AELDGYTAVLARLRAAIERGDGDMLSAVLTRARDAREQWNDRPANVTAGAATRASANGAAPARAGEPGGASGGPPASDRPNG
ncbi:MAG TPA: hypothetical protein VL424_12110, partial [Pararobbsia sp.]|nr:hypothetical protein [Pararobbsia sp.]